MTNEVYDAIYNYWSLKEDILYPFETKQVEEYPYEKEATLAKRDAFEKAKAGLNAVSEADLAQCCRNLILAIDEALRIISASKLGYPLARNQGLIIENYVYGKLLTIIHGAVKSPLGYGSSNFYYEKNGNFDPNQVISLLRDLKEQVSNFKSKNYLDFAKLYEDFRKKILDLWKAENLRMYGRENL
jgi:hypothetical protein